MKYFFIALVVALPAFGYVPTVESLFRNGNNPDVTTNAIMVSAKVSLHSLFEETTSTEKKADLWVRWIYNVTPQGRLKLTQLIYRAPSMTDASLVDKVFISELSPRSFGSTPNALERGLFVSLLNSLLINDGSFLVDFLRSKEISVRKNDDLINQEKKNLLLRHRSWLQKNNGGRGSLAEDSPINPADANEKVRVEQILSSPMYQDTKQVSLTRHQGLPAWHVKAEGFEAWVSDDKRHIQQVLMKSGPSEIELQFRDYLLLNGVHNMPRLITVKGMQDQVWKVEVMGVRTFNETHPELVNRLKRYDLVLRQKQETVERPGFFL
ncbi:MAG: hypothetical protein ACLGG7_06460 [Bacteriovoracia bacterium]